MFRGAASWLGNSLTGGGNVGRSVSTHSLSAMEEPAALEHGLKVMALIMNDDISGAESMLDATHNSSFHKLAQGVISFLRASLGFEAEVMREASERLAEAEASADRDRRRAQRDNHHLHSYPPGTEYALCHAEAQLMSAVVGVLSESVVDAMKAFYKLRRAYLLLEEIQRLTPSKFRGVDDENVAPDASSENAANRKSHSSRASVKSGRSLNMDSMDTMDLFIHSGANVCYGLLLVILSMIPPSLGKLLSIIGFRGDRDKGLEMLWKASKADNIHGAIASLALLNIYGNAVQFCDILPEEDGGGGYPRKKCQNALVTMRQRYPNSALWLLEEARMEAVDGELIKAVEILNRPVAPQMRQVEALMVFELALNSMFLHKYQEVADAFLKLIDLNSWSHALYHYLAGINYLELYRRTVATNPTQAQEYAKQAERLLELVPSFMGKKRFLAQQLPLELFAFRKLKKWQTRAAEMGVPLIEAIGVSPVEEMLYVWNGYKRMSMEDYETSFNALDWQKERLQNEAVDEQAVHALLTSVVYRSVGQLDMAKEQLQKVLAVDKLLLKGPNCDDWSAPAAHYEMAVVIWRESGAKGAVECKEWLQKAARWEAFQIDTRIGLRVTSALNTVDRFIAA